MTPAAAITPVWWAHDRLMLIDQTLLPAREVERACARWEDVAEAIRSLVVRGAPAIGVAAAYGVALAARASRATTVDALLADVETASKGLAATRPTAVNLFWAIDRMRRSFGAGAQAGESVEQIKDRLDAEAAAIHDEDVASCRAMGAFGAEVVPGRLFRSDFRT